MVSTLHDVAAQVVLLGAVTAAIVFLMTLAWKGFKFQAKVVALVEKSEKQNAQVVEALKPDNGGIGGAVTKLAASVDELKAEVRALDAKLEDHMLQPERKGRFRR